MSHLVSDLGHQPRGATVIFNLSGSEANVFLVDSTNYSNYKHGRQYRYFGGHTKKSPVRIAVPNASHWFAVVDTGGFGGRVSANIDVLKP
jgi:hypothetical protein